VVIDAHHHFWDPAHRAYPWMGPELTSIRRPFGPDELRPLLAASGVDRTVLVQTVSSLDETREFLAAAAVTDFIAGVVGWVDLTDPFVEETLKQLREGPGGNRLVGIRHQVHDEPDPGWLLRDDVQRGIRAVGVAGLVYDLLVKTRELPAALALARRLPDVRFVIDHLAKPRIAAGRRDHEWERALAPFAPYPNVHCKLSGMVTEASWERWTPQDLAPYVHRAVEWFGPQRLLFGSDWPVCLLAAGYDRVINALKVAIQELDGPSRDAVLGATAVRVYGLRR
jgi:L-fuconolactonase